MQYGHYQVYSAIAERLDLYLKDALFRASLADANHDTFAEGQHHNIANALKGALRVLVTELAFEEGTNEDIREEDYQFYGKYSHVYDELPGTFWELLDRKEGVQA